MKVEKLVEFYSKKENVNKVAASLASRIEKEIKKDKKNKLKARCLACIIAANTLTGCTTFGAHQMFSDSEAGFVMLAGDAEGIRAYNDGLIGVIADTKASPDVKSSYWQHRESQTQSRVMRLSSHNRSYSARKNDLNSNAQY